MDRSKWEYKKLGEVCLDFVVPQRDKPTAFDGDIPWCRIEDIDGRYLNGSKSGQNVTKELADKMNMHICPKGTVISACSASIGTQAITTTECYTNQTFIGLVVNPDMLYNVYLYYYLESKTNMLQGLGQGATIKYISKSKYQKMPIPLPSLADQQRIVAELDCLNEMIALKQEQLKEFDKLAQSIFYDMFGGDTYSKLELASLYEFIDYRGKTPNKIKAGIPLITARNIRFGYLDYSVQEYISEDEFETRQSRGIAKKGDLLFTTEAPMGFAAIADLDVFSTGQRVITFQLKNGVHINNLYMLYYLMSEEFQQILLNNATGVTVKGIKAAKLKRIKVSIPPLALQQQFAEKIQAIEAQKELVKQSIAETQHLLDSRMDYYFD